MSKIIRLTPSTFKHLQQKKNECGFAGKSNSAFIHWLLVYKQNDLL